MKDNLLTTFTFLSNTSDFTKGLESNGYEPHSITNLQNKELLNEMLVSDEYTKITFYKSYLITSVFNCAFTKVNNFNNLITEPTKEDREAIGIMFIKSHNFEVINTVIDHMKNFSKGLTNYCSGEWDIDNVDIFNELDQYPSDYEKEWVDYCVNNKLIDSRAEAEEKYIEQLNKIIESNDPHWFDNEEAENFLVPIREDVVQTITDYKNDLFESGDCIYYSKDSLIDWFKDKDLLDEDNSQSQGGQ